MKKLIFIILLFFSFVILNGQTYDKSVKVKDYGTFNKELSASNKISISSYVTKQNIIGYKDFEQKQKTLLELPKYRFELYLVSGSIRDNIKVDTWVYKARVFIDSVEVTRSQFPDGFSIIVKTEPTLVYWYETSRDSINFKISWESTNYFESKR